MMIESGWGIRMLIVFGMIFVGLVVVPFVIAKFVLRDKNLVKW